MGERMKNSALRQGLLLAAVDDQPMREIIRRYGDADAIAGQHADVVATHAARQLCAHDGSPLIDLDVVLAAAQGVLNDALHFQEVSLTHAAFRILYSKARGS